MVHYFRRSFVPILLDRVDFLLIVLSSMEFGLRYLCHTNRICSRINDALHVLLRMLYLVLLQWRLLTQRIYICLN